MHVNRASVSYATMARSGSFLRELAPSRLASSTRAKAKPRRGRKSAWRDGARARGRAATGWGGGRGRCPTGCRTEKVCGGIDLSLDKTMTCALPSDRVGWAPWRLSSSESSRAILVGHLEVLAGWVNGRPLRRSRMLHCDLDFRFPSKAPSRGGYDGRVPRPRRTWSFQELTTQPLLSALFQYRMCMPPRNLPVDDLPCRCSHLRGPALHELGLLRHLVGIGQCGTSIGLDAISRLTGFTKSKEITSRPAAGRSAKASNELLERLRNDYQRHGWLRRVRTRLRVLRDLPANVFVDPRLAVIDGNQDNYVMNAFSAFSGDLLDSASTDGAEEKYLAKLILDTTIVDIPGRTNGCAFGMVGEAALQDAWPGTDLRPQLGLHDAHGHFSASDGPIVRLFFVVASGAGGTGSGGAAHLSGSDVLLYNTSESLVVNLMILPSLATSELNPRYELNAGRFLARSSGVIVRTSDLEDGPRQFSTILFSNPSDEGDFKALQRLNDYVVEFALRCANFSYPNNVSRMGRDMDPREMVTFFRERTVVVGMATLEPPQFDVENREVELVTPAFTNMYEGNDSAKPCGISIETLTDDGSKGGIVLSSASSALVALGIPKGFGRLELLKIARIIKELSGSKLPAGIKFYSYGSTRDVELTIAFRYRNAEDNALVRHYVGKYVDDRCLGGSADVTEIEHLNERERMNDYQSEEIEDLRRNLFGEEDDWEIDVVRAGVFFGWGPDT